MDLKYCVFVAACSAAFAQYSGPDILTGGAVSGLGTRAGRAATLRYYLGASGEVSSGLLPVAVNSQGNLTELGSTYGLIGEAGAYGRKSWRHTDLGLDLRAMYRDYPGNPYYTGLNATLGLVVTHYLSRRLSMTFLNAGGSSTQSFSNALAYRDQAELVGVPTANIFDNRTYFWQTAGYFTYRMTARLSFTGGGIGFFLYPESKALVRTNGYGGQGAVTYALSGKSNVFGQYMFNHFDYVRAFGQSNIHSALAGISHALNEHWTAQVAGGAWRASTTGVTSVPADPITAALFGTRNVNRVFSLAVYYPAVQAQLTGKFQRSSISFSFSDAPTPGNGVYLTSDSKRAGVHYGYLATRNLSFGAGAGYQTMSSVGQNLGRFSYWDATGNMSYRILESLHATAQFTSRQIDTFGSNHLGYLLTLGITFSPGERPLAFW